MANQDGFHEAEELLDNNKILVRKSISSDIDIMVSISKDKRLSYEKAQPQFWSYSGKDGDNAQREWFKELLSHKDYIMFTAEDLNQEILGFIIGRLMLAPEVYNPGGLTIMIDDFCIKSEDLWISVGIELIKNIQKKAKEKGAVQVLVVCGAHDKKKRKFLMNQNLYVVSEWFVGGVV
jgi:hypothetical protein